MIDHLTIRVADVERSKAFYLAVLTPLGYRVHMELEPPGEGKVVGMGRHKPTLWLAVATSEHPTPRGMHVAFSAERRADVDAFHAAALTAGATDDGAPGGRAIYHPDYYGAFVIDPNGVHLEAVKHSPE